MRKLALCTLLLCLTGCSWLSKAPDTQETVYLLNNSIRVVTREVHKGCVDKVIPLPKCRTLSIKINLAQSNLRMATDLVATCGDCAAPQIVDIEAILADIETYLRASQ